VLNDLVERGLRRPQLFITDGNQGLLKAIRDVWPEVPRQRCAIHRIRNVLARVPKKRQDEVKKALHRIFYAACLDDARDEAKQFLSRYSREFPTACETLTRHLEECLTFYRFPNETSALVMVFGILNEERLKWQKIRMKADDIA